MGQRARGRILAEFTRERLVGRTEEALEGVRDKSKKATVMNREDYSPDSIRSHQPAFADREP